MSLPMLKTAKVANEMANNSMMGSFSERKLSSKARESIVDIISSGSNKRNIESMRYIVESYLYIHVRVYHI